MYGERSGVLQRLHVRAVRRLDVDLKYKGSGAFAADVASYVRNQYDDLEDQAEALAFNPQKRDALMRECLTAEIGDVKTVSESMSGLANTEVIVQALEYELSAGDWLAVRYVIAPGAPFKFWQLGTVGASELGETTVLGF